MVVSEMFGALVVKAARRVGAAVLENPERPRHAEMHQQDLARGEVGQQIFGPASEPLDGFALEPPDEILRQWPAQVTPARQHMLTTRAFKRRLQAAPDGLHFRQFGHALTFSVEAGWRL